MAGNFLISLVSVILTIKMMCSKSKGQDNSESGIKAIIQKKREKKLQLLNDS